MGDLFFDQQSEEEIWQEEPERRSRTGRWLVAIAVVLIAGLITAGAAATWVNRRVNPSGGLGAEVALTVPPGSTTQEIGELLAESDVITDDQVWRWYLRATGGGPFLAGDYTFRENSSMGDAVDVLEQGPALAAFDNVTIPEGLTLGEVVTQVGESGVLDAGRFFELLGAGTVRSRFQPPEVATLEGLLFPDTYRLEEGELEDGEGEQVLLERMVAALDANATDLGYDDALARTGRSPYEVLVIASLIEAEAKVDEDRARISRVIYNRLAEPMSLGIDATVYYALGRRGGSLTESDLAVDSPYNTRRYPGLPPTPIALPGRASLEAAINPEPGPWLYYVLADASGIHTFSEEYDQFLDDVAAAREKGLL